MNEQTETYSAQPALSSGDRIVMDARSQAGPARRIEPVLKKRHVTVVFAGRRDNYEVPLALAEAGWDVTLVTDVFAPEWLTRMIRAFRSIRAVDRLARRMVVHENVRLQSSLSIMAAFLARRIFSPLAAPRSAELLGELAGRIAAKRGGILVCYSTYGYAALPIARRAGVPCLLFQMHPHGATCVRLIEEITGKKRGVDRNIEWEYRLNERQYQAYINEWRHADRIIAASDFTKRSLTAAGAIPSLIDVVPYGASVIAGPAVLRVPRPGLPVVLFVGSFVRRKGALDFAALALALRGVWKFVAIGRGQMEEPVVAAFRASGVEMVIDADEAELSRRRAAADLFMLPSYLEGFGLVITEAMSAGLPVLTTTHTSGPDLIRDGIDGYVLEPGDVTGFEHILRELANDRPRLAAMSATVRQRVTDFTWERFRNGVVNSVERLAASAPRKST